MKHKLLSCFILSLFMVNMIFAQGTTITGVITDTESREPLPGVSVAVKGTNTGTVTDIEGRYSIVANQGATLVFSSIGMETQEVVVGTQSVINLSMTISTKELGEVVVTALGVSREERSLGYAVQEIQANQVVNVNESNVVGTLAGRVAGVQIQGSSGASIGGSQKIRLRGVTSLGANDSPLFVVDGTPINNDTYATATIGGGRDYGNLAGDINPNDIESISVLKGPSAAALYGQRGANGAIIITTKKGSKRKGVGIEINHSTTFERVYILPEYQNEYAGGYSQDFLTFDYDPNRHPESWASFDGQNILNYGADESWGPRIDGTLYRPWHSWYPGESFGKQVPLEAQPDNVRDFFNTGTTVNTNIALSGGNDKSSFRLSVGRIDTKGVQPNSSLDKTNISLNASTKLTEKLSVSASVNYVVTNRIGAPSTGYNGRNPVNSFNQWFHRQLDIDELRNYRNEDGTLRTWNIIGPNDYDPSDPSAFLVGQYWNSPYFEVQENASEDTRERVFGNFSISYEIIEGLTVSGFARTDYYSYNVEEKVASGGLDLDDYTNILRKAREDNYEFLAQYNKNIGQFSLNANLGANLRRNLFDELNQSTVGGLSSPNLYNIAASVDRPAVTNTKTEKEVRSIYGSVSLGYKEIVYLDLTARNDWSSALPDGSNSYFYPSVSSSFVFSELFDASWLSFAKIRASWAQVGSDTDPYSVFPVYDVGTPYGSNPSLNVPNRLNNANLKPQTSSNYEAGLEMRFLKNRIGFDLTYYYNPVENQILRLPVPGSSGYDEAVVNAGNITRQGIEFALNATPVQTDNFSWDLNFNIAHNYSEVKELTNDITNYQLAVGFRADQITLNATTGEEWGNLLGRVNRRFQAVDGAGNPIDNPSNGQPILSSSGAYLTDNGKSRGSILPDFTGGLFNTLTYKNWQLSALIDFQKGGQFFSVTRMFNAYSGLGIETVGNNDLGNPVRDPLVNAAGDVGGAYLPADNVGSTSGGVLVEGVNTAGEPVSYYVEAQTYWGRLYGNSEFWLYDASFVKLREVRLAYNLPSKLLSKTPFNSVNIAVIIKNAWLIHSNVDGIDPSEVSNGANGYGWVEGGTLPGVRSIGFNVRLGL